MDWIVRYFSVAASCKRTTDQAAGFAEINLHRTIKIRNKRRQIDMQRSNTYIHKYARKPKNNIGSCQLKEKSNRMKFGHY